MINLLDNKLYLQMSFNEQMAWIDEEVERIIKHNDKYNYKKELQEKGRNAYGQCGSTYAIKRLFDIIKTDPKNKAVLREVCQAEQELLDFLYDEPCALSEYEIYIYWNNYMQAYITELEMHPTHYFLVKGLDVAQKESENEWLGIYNSLGKLQDAYIVATQKLEEQHKNMIGLIGDKADYIVNHEKVIINAFDEFTGRWFYNISPEKIFWREKSN